MRPSFSLVGCALLLAFVLPQRADACPFCTSVSQTFGEEMESMQVVVFARLEQAPKMEDSDLDDPNALPPKAKFRVTQILKGAEWIDENATIEVLYFGEAVKDRHYLIMGTDAPQLMWTTPLALSERAYEYVKQVPNLPSGHERLEFFQDYLEDEDEMLARDAYDEFAKTPYDGIKALKDKMKHDQLIEFINDLEVPASRRRLYFVLLGVCGTPEDAPMLHRMMTSDDRKQKAGLDSLLACYLILTKQQGLAEVEELFLKDKEAEYADTYAAIMAIRFHGNDTDVIPRKDLVKALRHMLDRPQLADLVIPDLARWEDWEVLPRMVELFKQADDQSSWVRVPVVNYLRSCPLPEAKQYIEELAKIDPDAVKRAQTFFPFDSEGDGGAASQPADEKSSAVRPKSSGAKDALAPPVNIQGPADEGDSAQATEDADAAAPTQPAPIQLAEGLPGKGQTVDGSTAQPDSVAAHVSVTTSSSAPPETPQTDGNQQGPEQADAGPQDDSEWGRLLTTGAASSLANQDRAAATATPLNSAWLWGVPIVSGLALLYLFRLVLGVPVGSI